MSSEESIAAERPNWVEIATLVAVCLGGLWAFWDIRRPLAKLEEELLQEDIDWRTDDVLQILGTVDRRSLASFDVSGQTISSGGGVVGSLGPQGPVFLRHNPGASRGTSRIREPGELRLPQGVLTNLARPDRSRRSGAEGNNNGSRKRPATANLDVVSVRLDAENIRRKPVRIDRVELRVFEKTLTSDELTGGTHVQLVDIYSDNAGWKTSKVGGIESRAFVYEPKGLGEMPETEGRDGSRAEGDQEHKGNHGTVLGGQIRSLRFDFLAPRPNDSNQVKLLKFDARVHLTLHDENDDPYECHQTWVGWLPLLPHQPESNE